MPSTRFEPSSIKDKAKRQQIVRKLEREKGQRKLRSRLAIAKAEVTDPVAKKVRLQSFISLPWLFVKRTLFLPQKMLAQIAPKTLNNRREFDPSVLTADPRRAWDNPDSTSQPAEGFSDPSTASTDDVSMAQKRLPT